MATGDLTTLANVRAELGLDVTFTADDAYLSRQITAQSAFLISRLNRNILSQSYVETLDGNDPRIRVRSGLSPFGGLYVGGIYGMGYALTLYNSPVTSITTLYVDGGDSTGATTSIPAATNIGKTTQTDGYVQMDDRIELVGSTYCFTRGVGNVVITYVAGYLTTPPDVESCVIDLVAWQYRRKPRIGQRSATAIDGASISFDTGMPASFDVIVQQYGRVST